MKRIGGFLLLLMLIYSIYIDLTVGTIPTVVGGSKPASIQQTDAEPEGTSDLAYFNYKVKPGDTVLSVLEKQVGGPLPVPVTKAVDDFQRLNGKRPENINFGKTYKFPDYSQAE